jgi:hypothetical protein
MIARLICFLLGHVLDEATFYNGNVRIRKCARCKDVLNFELTDLQSEESPWVAEATPTEPPRRER